MKLFASFSEAIREGAKLRPQTAGVFFKEDATCALGAGAEALGFAFSGAVDYSADEDASGSVLRLIETEFPYLATKVRCPVADCDHEEMLLNAVWHLNDGSHGWTRERIADWLETEEEKLGFVTVVESEVSRGSAATHPSFEMSANPIG